MALLEIISKAAAAADAGEFTPLSNFPVAFNSDAVFPNLIPHGGDSVIRRVSGWKISETDSEFVDLSSEISKNLSRKLKNPTSLNRDEFLSILNSFLAEVAKNHRLLIGFEPSDSGFTSAAICKLGFLIGREIAGLVVEGCIILGLWEVLETLVIQGFIAGNLTSTILIAKLIEKNKPELLCLCIKHISDLRSSDLLSILKFFLSPSMNFYTNMVGVKKQWESEVLEAVEEATTKKGPAEKALRVAKEASVLLMMAQDGFSLRESCLHYVFGSMNSDEIVLSSAISRLSGAEVLGLVRYFVKWLEKYQRFSQAVPCLLAGSVLGLRACESVPSVEAVVSGLGLVLDEHFSFLMLNSQFHDEMRAVEKVVHFLASEARESYPINNIIKHLEQLQPGSKNLTLSTISSRATPGVIGFDDSSDTPATIERPQGRKVAKMASARKRKWASTSTGINEAQVTEFFREAVSFIREGRSKKEKIDERFFELKRKELDFIIMNKDTTGLPPDETEFWAIRKREVIRRRSGN